MKKLFALILISTSALAGECCTGSCWTTGCCDPRQQCRNQNSVNHYSCVNEKDSSDIIRVIRTNDRLTITTSSGNGDHVRIEALLEARE